jgi:hypothetical protein
MGCNEVEPIAVTSVDIPELSVADANCLLQHGGKHPLKVARRATDDLKNLGRCRLLLKRFR